MDKIITRIPHPRRRRRRRRNLIESRDGIKPTILPRTPLLVSRNLDDVALHLSLFFATCRSMLAPSSTLSPHSVSFRFLPFKKTNTSPNLTILFLQQIHHLSACLYPEWTSRRDFTNAVNSPPTKLNHGTPASAAATPNEFGGRGHRAYDYRKSAKRRQVSTEATSAKSLPYPHVSLPNYTWMYRTLSYPKPYPSRYWFPATRGP